MRQQAITWTNADLISEVVWYMPEGNSTKPQDILNMSLKVTNLRLQPHLWGANELSYPTI